MTKQLENLKAAANEACKEIDRIDWHASSLAALQRGNYERKLEAMRAYAKTPAGMASKKRSQIRYLAKRKECAEPKDELKINAQALFSITQNWGRCDNRTAS